MTLTQTDLNEIEKVVDEKIETRTRNLPTKDEFFGKMDEVMGELKAIREDRTIASHQLANHEDRITTLEEKTGITPV
jgi:hypothetical protein